EPRLGGRRRRPADEPDADPWWRVKAFGAYAAHARTPEFREAVDDLLPELEHPDGRTAVMCSESLWWRCLRRISSDVLVLLHGVDVQHLNHNGTLTGHSPAEGARIDPAGLVYDREA